MARLGTRSDLRRGLCPSSIVRGRSLRGPSFAFRGVNAYDCPRFDRQASARAPVSHSRSTKAGLFAATTPH